MNAKEALKALLEGKKVTRYRWTKYCGEGEYIQLTADGKFIDESGDDYSWDSLSTGDDWSIFGEPKTYTRAEALKLLAEGKKISNVLWENMYLYLSEGGNIHTADVPCPGKYDWNRLMNKDGFIVKE